MSATSTAAATATSSNMSTADAAFQLLTTTSVAHVNFRVRCENLGHGEEVFLVPEGDLSVKKSLCLYTTPAQYPWYHASAPLTLTLPLIKSIHDDEQRKKIKFRYRYAIYRAGLFHHWEQQNSDGPSDNMDNDGDSNNIDNDEDTPMIERKVTDATTTTTTTARRMFHEIPLHLMHNRETYVVSDVLGMTWLPPDIDHVILKQQNGPSAYAQASTLHNRVSSNEDVSFVRLSGGTSSQHSSGVSLSPAAPSGSRKKGVNFAPTPPPYHGNSGQPKQTVNLSNTDGLVVVSIFLPVIVKRSDDGRWSADWDYEMLLSMQTHLRVTRIGVVKWRGWHGNHGNSSLGDEGSPELGVPRAERHLVEACLLPFNCVPVWIDAQRFGEMYNGFCKGVLWPVLHNVTSVYSYRPEETETFVSGDIDNDKEMQFSEYSMDDVEQGPIHGGRGREAELWCAFNTVNRRFSEVVIQNFNEGDLIWVHGFHLLILPSYLTRHLPMAKVGIFLHTPFPSSEIFRTVWCREDLLRGMLNADQVGFHLFEYSRHFLTSCRRLLGLNYGMVPDTSGGHTLAIDTNGRHVAVTSIHAGVEPPVLYQILAHSSTLEKCSTIRRRFEGMHICCAIDRLESLKGIPLKLLGLERFLTRCPEWVGKIVLIQVGISAYERGDDYLRTKKEVTKIVDKINHQWPGTVQFQECVESEMRLQQRMALLRASDTMIITAIRDGLNLLPLEYTLAHQDALTEMGKKDRRKRGTCILSEFSSCTRVMRGALHINPWKISEVAAAIYQAVNMSEEERLRRISIASEFVTRVTTQRWALAVMLDLKGVHKSVNPVQYSASGLGLNYRLLGMLQGFVSLDTNLVAKAYRNARARLILLDYGGTIVNNDNLDNLTRFQMVKERSAPSLPTSRMVEALKGLCSDRKNIVFVVSGKERHSLMKSLQGIPNLGLAAEHGMFISWPNAKVHDKRKWETLVAETDVAWRGLAISIMEVYTSRTHGSYIEETEMKVLWQYRDADTEFGALQAKELEDHLSKYLRGHAVDILHGGIKEGGYVEVRPKGVNKGVLAMKVMKRFPEFLQRKGIEFALVLGDDHCDEPMLSVMRQIGRRVCAARRAARGDPPPVDMPATIQLVDVSSVDPFVTKDLEVFTCTVGKKPSAAASYLHDVEEVQELLESLVKVTTRENGYFSSNNLTSLNVQSSMMMSGDNAGLDMDSGFMLGSSFNNSDNMSRSWSMRDVKTTPDFLSAKTSTPISSNLTDFLQPIADEDEEIYF